MKFKMDYSVPDVTHLSDQGCSKFYTNIKTVVNSTLKQLVKHTDQLGLHHLDQFTEWLHNQNYNGIIMILNEPPIQWKLDHAFCSTLFCVTRKKINMKQTNNKYETSVADPGFSQRGRQPLGGGYGIRIYLKFYQKLHEIENNLVAGAGGGAPCPPLDPPLECIIHGYIRRFSCCAFGHRIQANWFLNLYFLQNTGVYNNLI